MIYNYTKLSSLFLLHRRSYSSRHRVLCFFLSYLINFIQHTSSSAHKKLLFHAIKRWFFKLLKCYWNVNRRLTIKKMFLACFRQNISTKRSHALPVEKKQDSLFILLTFFKLRTAAVFIHRLWNLFFPDKLKCNNFSRRIC